MVWPVLLGTHCDTMRWVAYAGWFGPGCRRSGRFGDTFLPGWLSGRSGDISPCDWLETGTRGFVGFARDTSTTPCAGVRISCGQVGLGSRRSGYPLGSGGLLGTTWSTLGRSGDTCVQCGWHRSLEVYWGQVRGTSLEFGFGRGTPDNGVERVCGRVSLETDEHSHIGRDVLTAALHFWSPSALVLRRRHSPLWKSLRVFLSTS